MGGIGGGFTERFKVMAKIEEMTGSEVEQAAGNLSGMTKAQMVVRANSQTEQITAAWRLVAKGRNWNVKSIARGAGGMKRNIDIAGAMSNAYLTIQLEAGVAA